MSENRNTYSIVSLALGAACISVLLFFWWKMGFDGLKPIVVRDNGIFGEQRLTIDLSVLGTSIISTVVFLRAATNKSTRINTLVALAVSGAGVALCASAQQFWYFSVGLVLLAISSIVETSFVFSRNLMTLMMVSVFGTATEPYFDQAPNWFLALFFLGFVLIAFRVFPNAIQQESFSKEKTETPQAWILSFAPALASALFVLKKMASNLHEQEALFLKGVLCVFVLATLLRGCGLRRQEQGAQSHALSLGLLVIYSSGITTATEWAPACLLSVTAAIVALQVGLGRYQISRWVAAGVVVFLCSPVSIFGHGMILSIGGDEFVKNPTMTVIPLILFGLSFGSSLALSLVCSEERGTRLGDAFLGGFLLLIGIEFLWNSNWLSDSERWAPGAIVAVLGVTAVLAHHAIGRLFASFGEALRFQDGFWLRLVGFSSEKVITGFSAYEEKGVQNGIAKGLRVLLDGVSSVLVRSERGLFHKIVSFSRSAATRASEWVMSTQTTDAQYYLIFGIGTVVLVLLHFFINAIL